MKNKFLFLFVIIVLFTSYLTAQEKVFVKSIQDKNIAKEPYPVHAREYLERFYEAVGFDPKAVALETEVSLQKTAWNFQVGTQQTWRAVNFNSNSYYNVNSTCRAVGTNCYIFVENSIWGNSVTDAGVNAVVNAFDNQTPANANKGIFETVTGVFGNPPDRDQDPRIIILILDIQDSYNPPDNIGYIAGYFSTVNQSLSDQNSNKAEIFYIDGVQSNLTTTGGLNMAMSTVAHEFQHMIRFAQFDMFGIGEETFYDECLSLSAEIVCGYSVYNQSLYANETNYFLTDWRPLGDSKVYNDYSRAAKLGLYLYEQFGTGFFTRYRNNKVPNKDGFIRSINESGTGRTYASVLGDWFVANYLNNRNVDLRYGYNYSPIVQVASTEHFSPEVTRTNNVMNFASQYIAFTGGSNLSIRFNNLGRNLLKVKSIKYFNNSLPIVEDVQADNSIYSVPELGSSVSKVAFVIYYVDTGTPLVTDPKRGPYNFSYTATGTAQTGVQELAYDLTEPTGYLPLSLGDSVAVVFNAFPGAKLDSIRVALRGVTQINGGVYEFVGLTNRLGGKNLGSFTAIPTLSAAPPVLNQGAEYPYEIPYPNWVTVDLRSFNIDASKDFTVIFPIGATYPSTNRVMSTYYQSETSYNSFTYASTQSPPRWLYYGVQDRPGYIFLYLIRAYISFGTSDNKEEVELLPSAFSLEQNYPNPFNPSTIISYQIPNQSRVQIRIFDALGREIRSLIDEEKSTGKYNIAWDGRDNYGNLVSSGNYFYTITAGDFVQTKKMILIK